MAKRFRDINIRSKLIFAYSVLFILILILSNSAIYFLVKQSIEKNIESELKNSTASIRNMVETAANVSIKNHLRAIAWKNKEIVGDIYGKYESGEITENQARNQATNVLLSQTIGKTGYIYCLNSNGVIQVHPERSLIGKNIANYTFAREQISRQEGYIEYDWRNPGETDQRPKALYMTLFKPWDWIISVSSYREEFKNLVNVSDFKGYILALKFGDTGYSYVIDSKGNGIIHPLQPNVNIWNSEDSEGRFFIQEMCRKKNGRIIYAWQNPGEKVPREKLVIFSYLPEFDWIVASSSYFEEIYRPLVVIRYIIMVSAVIALILILPITMWIGSFIINPLQRAVSIFQSAKEGDFSIRMEVKSADEIGQLSCCFNEFMDKLQAYSDKLDNLNEDLEFLVDKRTSELIEAITKVKTLSGLLPICANCKKIRDDSGYWTQIESYISEHSEADFSHSICPDCVKKLYPELYDRVINGKL